MYTTKYENSKMINIFNKPSQLKYYPQRMGLQRRLYGTGSVRILVGQKWLISFYNNQNTKLNAETKNQALNRHIFSFGSSSWSHPLWVTLCLSKQ